MNSFNYIRKIYLNKKPSIYEMVNETNTITERTVLYNTVRATLMAFATNNISTIVLMGGGGNGKSYLINECKNNLTHYDLYDGHLYDCERNEAVEILSSPNQKIVSSLCNPFEKFDIEQPDECVIIDMNDIRF